jgi:hypothetical protein
VNRRFTATYFAALAVESGCVFCRRSRIQRPHGASWNAWPCHHGHLLSHHRPHPSPQRAPGLAAPRLMTLIRRHRLNGTRVETASASPPRPASPTQRSPFPDPKAHLCPGSGSRRDFAACRTVRNGKSLKSPRWGGFELYLTEDFLSALGEKPANFSYSPCECLASPRRVQGIMMASGLMPASVGISFVVGAATK